MRSTSVPRSPALRLKRAEELRQSGKIVSVLPMTNNLGRQIELLEKSGYSQFEKVYND